MKYPLTIIVFLVAFIAVKAQLIPIELNSVTSTCPSSNETIKTFENWEIFQTYSGQIDGERTLECFEAFQSGAISGFENAFDFSPLFMKNIQDLNIELTSEKVFRFKCSLFTTELDFCNCNLDCFFNECFSAKLYFTTEVNGESVQYERMIYDPLITNESVSFHNCFILNQGENTKLNFIEFVIPKESFSHNELLFVLNMSIQQSFGSPFINRVIPNSFNNGSGYFVDSRFFNDQNFGQTLALHNGPGEPGSQNRYFYDMVPEDSTSRQIINIFLTRSGTILFQDYTHLRTALVAQPGNQTLRHRYNIINDGATICFDNVVEIISNDDDSFIYKSGKLDFHSSNGCLQFNNDAQLVVSRGATLDYGRDGIGLLALSENAELIIENNATLNFNGKMLLKKKEINNASVTLNPNTKLIFGPHSSIRSLNDPTEVQFTIHVKGGHLDVSHLDAESLSYLNIIYDEDEIILEDRFLFYPNPSDHFLYVNNLTNFASKFLIYNQNNMLVERIEVEAFSKFRFDSTNLAQGIYFIKSDFGVIKKFVVSR